MSHPFDTPRTGPPLCVPKLIGADTELGNLILGAQPGQCTGHQASRAVLREIDGVSDRGATVVLAPGASWQELAGIPAGDHGAGTGSVNSDGTSHHWPHTHEPHGHDNPQDIGRKYLASNGGCAYIDLDHLELCTPEVRSAHDFVAAWHALLRIARRALVSANAKRPAHGRVVVLVNSSDGLGNAYGSHLNFLVTRRFFDDLFTRRLHPSLFLLAAYQVSSIVFTGQGKVGAENGRPPVAYQLSQRADFFERIVALQTTHDRPIVNSRDEPLCGSRPGHTAASGPGADLARLHCIFYDSTLCHASTLLKVGVMQIVLCMLEAQQLDASLILADPLAALLAYSHDPDLHARARLADGRSASAVELQSMFCERARAFVDAGGCEALVPGAAGIVNLWADTLERLARRDFESLAPRLDWVLKRVQIERALTSRGLDWAAPEAKHLDHLYASLERDEGLYWALEAAGCTETLADEARVRHFTHSPPEDTRAWTRSMLLKRIPRARVRRVDWDAIELAPLPGGHANLRVSLPDPLGHTREHWLNARGQKPSTRAVAEPRLGTGNPRAHSKEVSKK